MGGPRLVGGGVGSAAVRVGSGEWVGALVGCHDGNRRWLCAGGRVVAVGRRGAAVVLLACAVVVLGPAVPAQAHPAGVQVAVDYRTRVTAVVPVVAGVRARYIADGSRLELRNDSGRTIEVVGYQGEPMLQVRPDGVWRNTRAPSLYVDNLGAAINPAADAHAAPQWQRMSDRPLARWQDHRALWHGSPPPQVQADPSRVHRVSDWRVPLRDGDATAQITGTLDWVPPPDPGRWWAAVLLLVAAAIGALGLVASAAGSRAARGVRAGLAGSAFAVGLATAGYPLLVVADNAEPGAGSVAVALVSQAVPLLVGLALMAAGGFVLARREVGDFGLAAAGVCAALFVGAANAALFSHPVAPITLDGGWARLAVAVILGGGIGLAGAGVLRIRRWTRTATQPAPAR
jgi:hypothetical protein